MTQRSHYYVQKLALGVFAVAAMGCASNVPTPKDGRAAGEWRYRLPATSSPYGQLALGRGGSSEPARLEADQPLLAAAQPTPKHVARPVHVQRVAAQPVLPAVETAPAAEPSSPAQVSEPIQLAQNEVSPEQRYAQRQSESKQLEKYKGGDAIVIGAGTLVVILLVVILLILILR
jgi:hypothetical protein